VTGFDTLIGTAPSQPEALVLSTDGEMAITGGTLGEVIAWPMHGGAPRILVKRSGRMVRQLRLSADRRLLIERESSAPLVASLDGGEPLVLGPTSGLKFAVADDDWSHVVMMTAANEVAAVAPGGSGGGPRLIGQTDKAIEFLAISPCGDTVLIHDGATIWSLPYGGGPRRELARYEDRINHIVWSRDGKTIAIGGHRPEILLVDARSGAVTELRGHTDAIYMLELSRDGTQLLSASDDATARVWLLANGTALVLRGHDDDVYRARFSADERSVATASLDGSARLWPIDRPTSTM
jgi:WD40 repeat protein